MSRQHTFLWESFSCQNRHKNVCPFLIFARWIPHDGVNPVPIFWKLSISASNGKNGIATTCKYIGLNHLNLLAVQPLGADIPRVASEIRQTLHFDIGERGQARTWMDALRLFVDLAEKIGILVMVSGVVGSNNKRTLEPEEFRGFTLVDNLAPLIFINARDTKAAQMFTLAHELAHIWVGESGVSDTQAVEKPDEQTERWCNQVAAELLVPLADLQNNYLRGKSTANRNRTAGTLLQSQHPGYFAANL